MAHQFVREPLRAEEVTPHVLRHTWVTLALQKGISLAAVQKILAHDRLTTTAILDLSWVPDKWWKLVTGSLNRNRMPAKVDRRHFEVCLFSQIVGELKSGDLSMARRSKRITEKQSLDGGTVLPGLVRPLKELFTDEH